VWDVGELVAPGARSIEIGQGVQTGHAATKKSWSHREFGLSSSLSAFTTTEQRFALTLVEMAVCQRGEQADRCAPLKKEDDCFNPRTDWQCHPH
jgi:hypothetical protein